MSNKTIDVGTGPASSTTPVSPTRAAMAPRAGSKVSRGLAVAGFSLLGILVFLLSVGVAMTLGPADVSLVNVRDIITNHLGLMDIPIRVSDEAIVWQERLPRALVAAACGAGLGLCGTILQSLLRNPLADPF
ncbi:MAG: iron chelate uptake ABC transporter family permease subunit, partial [Corynebacterium flavescens]|nr:iron chelate uptake ABC transporter family permease subunit [Corynebacterium flavescens]